MRRGSLLYNMTLMTLLASCLAAGTLDVIAAPRQFCSVYRTPTAPVIDGKMDDCYCAALPVDGLSLPSTMTPAADATVMNLVHDGTMLYGYVTCKEPNMDKMPIWSKMRDDSRMWTGDALEMLIRDDDGLKHFMFSPDGGVYDAAGQQDEAHAWRMSQDWSSSIQVAAKRESDSWRIEFALPLKSVPGENLKFNIVRDYPSAAKACSWARLENYGWLPKGDGTDVFGDLRIVDGPRPEGIRFSNRSVSGADGSGTIREARDGEELVFRHVSMTPKGYISLTPGNIMRGRLFLNGNRGIEAKIFWLSHHNYPGARAPGGGKVDKPFSIEFDVPDGVVVLNAKKTGSRTEAGATRSIFTQRERFAYNVGNYTSSGFKTTLKAGTRGTITYRVKHADGEQAARDVAFEVIDVAEPAALREFFTGHYNLWVRTLAEAQEWSRTGANTFALRGFGDRAAELARQLAAAGFRVRRADYFWPGAGIAPAAATWQTWTREDETARAKDISGAYIAQGKGFQLSPSYRGKCLVDAVAKECEFCKRAGIDWFAFDLEDYIQKKGELGDFRDETVAAFKKRWISLHGGGEAPDPFRFERDPAAHPEEHRAWVDSKCELWGGFMEEMKGLFEKGLGRKPIFSDWSLNHFRDVEARNHSLRNARYYGAFDYVEIGTYSSLDRDLRQIERQLADFRREFPSTRLNLVISPCPFRLGLGKDPSSHYWSSAPEIPDESKYTFMEAATLGAKGIYTWNAPKIDMEYLRQFVEGMNIIAKVEDIVMHGATFDLETDQPADAAVTDNFHGKRQTWTGQKRVFARANALGGRTLLSVSEYRGRSRCACRTKGPSACRTWRRANTSPISPTGITTCRSSFPQPGGAGCSSRNRQSEGGPANRTFQNTTGGR